MINLVLTLVFSIVMLVFMAFPAMKITAWLKQRTDYSEKVYNMLQIAFTIILSLLIGIFLKFA